MNIMDEESLNLIYANHAKDFKFWSSKKFKKLSFC